MSVMGLGCGGHSRLGKSKGHNDAEAVAVVKHAIEAGVNYIDTAEIYFTEKTVGKAIQGIDRESLVLSTKKFMGIRLTKRKILKSIDASLKRLGTKYIDIYNFHAVPANAYEFVSKEMLPAFKQARDEGKIRFFGITESFGRDPGHVMLSRALQDDCWDAMMVGFNILNQSARERVFSVARQNGVGIVVMHAVRRALAQPDRLKTIVRNLVSAGKVDAAGVDLDDPLGFVVHEGGATSVVDASYRFCRHEPGTHVILSGTGSIPHLDANIASFSRPALPEADAERLVRMFLNVDTGSAD